MKKMNTSAKFHIPYQFPFVDGDHRDFFDDRIFELGVADPSDIAAVYLLSALEETRAAFWDLMGVDGHMLDDCWTAGWQTPDTRRCVALASNLTDGTQYPDLSPASLYASPLRPVLAAAVAYWYAASFTA